MSFRKNGVGLPKLYAQFHRKITTSVEILSHSTNITKSSDVRCYAQGFYVNGNNLWSKSLQIPFTSINAVVFQKLNLRFYLNSN